MLYIFNLGDRRDWGTGITQKKFRVGSPTFFSNPNINIPGLMDDLDGFSCSDSEEEPDDLATSKKLDIDEVEDVGHVRIEFRGRNLAEAIEDEEQTKNRMATLAKNQEEDQIMVSELPWPEMTESAETEPKIEKFVKEWTIVKVEEPFKRDRQHQGCTFLKQASIQPLLELPMSTPFPISTRELLSPGIIPRDCDVVPEFSFDLQPNLQDTDGPSPSLLLQALTMSNSNDVINLG